MRFVFVETIKYYVKHHLIAWFVSVFLLCFTCILYFICFRNNNFDLKTAMTQSIVIMLFTIPVLTSSVFNDIEMFREVPLIDIVFSKFLVLLLIFSAPLLISLQFVLPWTFMLKFPLSNVFSPFIGFFLLGSLFISWGIFIAFFQKNKTLATINTLICLIIFYALFNKINLLFFEFNSFMVGDFWFKYLFLFSLLCLISLYLIVFVQMKKIQKEFIFLILFVFSMFFLTSNLKLDLTKDKRYSLSTETIDLMKDVDKKTAIYTIFNLFRRDENMDLTYRQLKEYSRVSKIKLANKNPLINPNFITTFIDDNIYPEGLIVVEKGAKNRIIALKDIITTDIDDNYNSYIAFSDLESYITNCILYVNSEKSQTVYITKMNGEIDLHETFLNRLIKEQYDVKFIDEFTDIKEKSLLLIASPSADFSKEDTLFIKDYLKNGGKAIFLLDPQEEKFTNLESVVNNYGIYLSNCFLVEGDEQFYVQNYPLNIVCKVLENDATKAFAKNIEHLLIPNAQAVFAKDKAFDILKTSQSSYLKTAKEVSTVQKEKGDTLGSFSIASAFADENTKVLVIGNAFFLNETINNFINDGNYNFLVNCINWAIEKENAVYLPVKKIK